MERYAANGKELDLPHAEYEVVADWIGKNLYKSGFAKAIVNGDATVGNAFVQAIDKMRLALGTKKSRSHTNLAVVERLFMRALEQEQVTYEGDVEYFASSSEKGISIKEQLREHLDEINEMEPVANINYHHINRLTARQAVSEEFKRLGYKVDRQGFGIIEIGENEIGVSADYVHTPAECAAWLAVPKVLKRGKIIYTRDNHKGRGHDTITIAAPVIINGTPGVMGVSVKQTGKNHYKSHRILMPDGSAFEYRDAKDAEPTSAGMTAQKSGEGPTISSASNTRLSQNDPRVKNYSMQNAPKNCYRTPITMSWK